MAYHKETYYTDYDTPARVGRTEYTPKHTEQLTLPNYHLSRSTEQECGVRGRSSKYNRTATGYIDRRSCPSYPYITTRSRSPDISYIARPLSYSDDHIQPSEQHHSSQTSRRPRDRSDQARWKVQAFSSKEEFMRSYGMKERDGADLEEAERFMDGYCRLDAQGSDVEDLVPYQNNYRRDKRRNHDSEDGEGSDIVSEKKRSVDSDVASISNRRSSYSHSDRRSVGEVGVGVGSDIQERRGSSDTDSDCEDGYISLDDYIGSESDCVSNRWCSEDGGEGSDAVMEHGSDVADALDLEGFDEGEDCIQDDYSGFCENDVY